jgi:transposase
MANKPVDMHCIRQILRLYSVGTSKQKISRYLGLSRNTIKKYIKLFEQCRLTFEELSELDDKDLEDLYNPVSSSPQNIKDKELENYFSYMSRELKRVGVTRYLLWQEYIEKVPSRYSYSRFCHLYKQ